MDQERHDVGGRSIVLVNDGNAYVAAGLAGLGVIQALTFAVQQHISAGALKPVLVNWTTEPLPLYVVFPPTKHFSNKLRVFVDWVADLFASHALMQRRSRSGA
jgi:LysR family transcriptional regulator, regulator for bpeEF and oprC